MAIKESLLTVVNSISDSDFVRAVTSAGASRKLSVSNLARHIVETYNGSTIAGSAQSVKSAVDALTTIMAVEPVKASAVGTFEYTIRRAGKVVSGSIVFSPTSDIDLTNGVIVQSGMPSPANASQLPLICVGGSQSGKVGRVRLNGTAITAWYTTSCTPKAGDTFLIPINYICL